MRHGITITEFLATLVLLIGGIVVFYKKLFLGFFQGDEWVFFERFLPYSQSLSGSIIAALQSITNAQEINGSGHATPIPFFLFTLSMSAFGLNHTFWATSSILLHITNSALLIIFAAQLTKNKNVALISGLFFAFSSTHQQAITWMMNHLFTTLSVTFILTTLILFIHYFVDNEFDKKGIVLVSLTAFLALLTKESAIVLFPTMLLITFRYRKCIHTLKTSAYLLTLFLIFIFYRFGIVSTLGTNALEGVSNLTPELVIFRAISYPLRAITLVFTPSTLILSLSESLTGLAYPIYGAEKEVRGSTFLNFTQSAGSDIFIFSIATLILTLTAVLWSSLKNNNLKWATAIGLVIFSLSALPLIMIAIYAPWWGYATFLDSRHLYLPSVGGAIMFSIGLCAVSKYFSRLTNRRIKSRRISMLIMIGWSIWQFNVLDLELTKQGEVGRDRYKILSFIDRTIPTYPDKAVIYIKSDSAYYGFGDPMPPFQTNFGQVLSVLFGFRGDIDVEQLDTSHLTVQGIAGQGYKEVDGRGFGYFISEQKLNEFAQDTGFPLESVYAFSWNGKERKVEDITVEERGEIKRRLEDLALYKNWIDIKLQEGELSLKIPPNGKYENGLITTPDKKVKVRILNRTGNLGIYEDISLLENSDGKIIGSNFYYRNIEMKNGTSITVKITSEGSSSKYFIPTFWPDKIVEVTAINEPAQLNKEFSLAEEIISLMRTSS